MHVISELSQLHLFVLHGISLRHEHLISFSNPVEANEVSGGGDSSCSNASLMGGNEHSFGAEAMLLVTLENHICWRASVIE